MKELKEKPPLPKSPFRDQDRDGAWGGQQGERERWHHVGGWPGGREMKQ